MSSRIRRSDPHLAGTIRSKSDTLDIRQRGGALLAGFVASLSGLLVAATSLGGELYWWILLLSVTCFTLIWAFLPRRLSFPIAGLSVLMLVQVVIPAYSAASEGVATANGYSYSNGVLGAIALALVAQSGLLFGAVFAYKPTSEGIVRQIRGPIDGQKRRQLARVAGACTAVGALAGMVLFQSTGASLSDILVVGGRSPYGAMYRDPFAVPLKALQPVYSLLGLGVIALMLRMILGAPLPKFSILGKTLLHVPVIAFLSYLLVIDGQRQRLVVSLVAAGLLWWRWTPMSVARYGRSVFLIGVFLLALLAGVVREARGITSPAQAAEPRAVLWVGDDLFTLTAGLVEYVPDRRQYLYGRSYAEIAFMPIPRAIWRGKPDTVFRDVTTAFADPAAGASFMSYGEMYMNFSWAGAFVGFFLLGTLAQRSWHRLITSTYLGVTIVHSVTMAVLMQLATRGYAAGQIAAQSGLLIGALLFGRYVDRPAPQRILSSS